MEEIHRTIVRMILKKLSRLVKIFSKSRADNQTSWFILMISYQDLIKSYQDLFFFSSSWQDISSFLLGEFKTMHAL